MKKSIALCVAAVLSMAVFGCAKQETKVAAPAEVKTKVVSDRYKVGVILPLTGKQRIYGESTLHGIECAVGVFSPCDQIISAELIIKDDQSDPAKAVAAVDELVTKDSVSVILGPLSSATIEAAARRAQELGVPLISLSQQEGISQIGDAIFSVALTSKAQAEKIVEWSAKNKKAKSFAILYPMNAYGQKFKSAFAEAVAAHRGKIVKSEAYGEATADFGGFFAGDAKFDALFIPDSYRAVTYIAASIPFGYLDGVQLLGNNRWNNNELVERGADYVNGAVFVDAYFDGSSSGSVRRFSGAFEEAYKMKPTILEAQAFDAMRLAAKALQLTGGEHAADMKQTLQTLPDVEGATGQIGFDSNREIIRKLFLLTVADGKISELGSVGGPVKKDKYGDPIKE